MSPTSSLEPVSDPTGQLSQEEINAQNISNLIDTVNGLMASAGNILNQPTYTMVNDGTTNRALIGFNQYTGTWGIYSVPSGTDLSTATTAQQFSLSSDYPSIVVIGGEQTTTIPGFTFNNPNNTEFVVVNTVVAHGLTYTPAVLAYVNAQVVVSSTSVKQTNIQLPTPTVANGLVPVVYSGTDGASCSPVYYFSVDATNIYFVGDLSASGSGSGSVTVPTLTITYYTLTVTA